jgi:hypothetical protein
MLTELLPKNIDKCNVDIWSREHKYFIELSG